MMNRFLHGAFVAEMKLHLLGPAGSLSQLPLSLQNLAVTEPALLP